MLPWMAFDAVVHVSYVVACISLTSSCLFPESRGAYCAAVIISLLHLPLDLAPDSPARAGGHTRLFDGLAEWVRRCKFMPCHPSEMLIVPFPLTTVFVIRPDVRGRCLGQAGD